VPEKQLNLSKKPKPRKKEAIKTNEDKKQKVLHKTKHSNSSQSTKDRVLLRSSKKKVKQKNH
jgi:hypothetical protein